MSSPPSNPPPSPPRPEMPSPGSFSSLDEFIRYATSQPSGDQMQSPDSFSSRQEFLRSQSGHLSRLVPSVIVGIANLSPENQQQQSVSDDNQVIQRFIAMTIGMSAHSESRMRDLLNKDGPSPASKASIEALPVVEITEEGAECSICLTEYEVGEEAKEMPCKHKYHSECIQKWLGIHGSCPVCRYNMPVEEKKSGEEEDGGGGEIVVEEYMVYISRTGGRRSDSGQDE